MRPPQVNQVAGDDPPELSFNDRRPVVPQRPVDLPGKQLQCDEDHGEARRPDERRGLQPGRNR